MAATANTGQWNCTCGARTCQTYTANCRNCRRRTAFHVSVGDIHPIEFWECEECGTTYERQLMTPKEIYREARRGFVYAP